jgi:hypothetical protein
MHSVILYYVVQAQAAERHRQAQREAPGRAARRARRTRAPRRGHRARGLPAMEALRVLTVRGGGSP